MRQSLSCPLSQSQINSKAWIPTMDIWVQTLPFDQPAITLKERKGNPNGKSGGGCHPVRKPLNCSELTRNGGERQANCTKNVGKKAPERGVPGVEQHLMPLRNWTIGGCGKFSRNIWFVSCVYLESIPRPLIKNTLKIKTSTMNRNTFKGADI